LAVAVEAVQAEMMVLEAEHHLLLLALKQLLLLAQLGEVGQAIMDKLGRVQGLQEGLGLMEH
jgi:hypothetical protein